MYNVKQSRLNINRLVFCTFGFYNHNNKYRNKVLFAFVSITSLILDRLLPHILEINFLTTPSINLLFVYMFIFLT
jgi:hypothetical protein